MTVPFFPRPHNRMIMQITSHAPGARCHTAFPTLMEASCARC